MSHYLSLILFTPLVGALILLLVHKQNENAIRWIANIVAFIGFLISMPLWFWYNPQNADFQFVERAPWIPSIGAEYFLGVDGFSTLLILLTTMMGFIAVLSSWTAITERVKEYYIFLLVLQTGMLGAFMSLDFLLFFLFWEVMLVPMYFLIGIWGSAEPAVLGDQVLPLHAGRQRRHAARHPGAVLLHAQRRPACTRSTSRRSTS